MTRAVWACAIPILIGMPLWMAPTWGIGGIAAASGLSFVIGLISLSMGAITVGGILTLIELALALSWSSSSMNVFSAAGFGLALLVLVDAVNFMARFNGAKIDPSVLHRQIAWWIGRAAIVLVAIGVLAGIASGLALALPVFGRPAIAGLGAVIAFAAAMALARPQADERC